MRLKKILSFLVLALCLIAVSAQAETYTSAQSQITDPSEKWIRAELARIEQKFEARFEGMDKALKAANIVLQERFHQINGLRTELNAERVNYASKDMAKVAAVVYAILIAAIGYAAWRK